jgi:hypothetical protein
MSLSFNVAVQKLLSYKKGPDRSKFKYLPPAIQAFFQPPAYSPVFCTANKKEILTTLATDPNPLALVHEHFRFAVPVDLLPLLLGRAQDELSDWVPLIINRASLSFLADLSRPEPSDAQFDSAAAGVFPSLHFVVKESSATLLGRISFALFCEFFRVFAVRNISRFADRTELCTICELFEDLFRVYRPIPGVAFEVVAELASAAASLPEAGAQWLSAWLGQRIRELDSDFPPEAAESVIAAFRDSLLSFTPLGSAFLQYLPVSCISPAFRDIVRSFPS